MENYITTINSIEELNAKIETRQAEIKAIDTETASLEAVEGDNKLEVQQQRLTDLERAVVALSTESARKAVDMEIGAIKESIKNINRLAELADQRIKTLQRLQKLSNDLTAVIGIYKGYRMNFEKKFNKVSKDTIKLLSNEDVPDIEFDEDEEDEVESTITFSDPPEVKPAQELSFGEEASEEEVSDDVSEIEEVEETNELSETASEEEVPDLADVVTSTTEETEETIKEVFSAHPIMALARVLRRYEELTSQENAERYSSKYASIFKEMDVADEDEAAIYKILEKEEVDGLTDDQVEILRLSIPKELLIKFGKKDIIAERKRSEVYEVDYLNKFRPLFTYKVIAELGRIVLSDEPEGEKSLKISLFFKNNSDHMIKGRFGGAKAEYRAFAVLHESDLEIG